MTDKPGLLTTMLHTQLAYNVLCYKCDKDVQKKLMAIPISKYEGPQSWEYLDQMDKFGGIKAMQHSPTSPAPDLVF